VETSEDFSEVISEFRVRYLVGFSLGVGVGMLCLLILVAVSGSGNSILVVVWLPIALIWQAFRGPYRYILSKDSLTSRSMWKATRVDATSSITSIKSHRFLSGCEIHFGESRRLVIPGGKRLGRFVNDIAAQSTDATVVSSPRWARIDQSLGPSGYRSSGF
jgi:hypothetical protein